MAIYKATIDGRNCWANLDGTRKRLGFVTIRAGKGTDAIEAVGEIERKIREELRSILLNKPEDAPEITVGEICEIDEPSAREIPDAGCTWYPDESPSQS